LSAALKAAAVGADALRPPPHGLTVLIYHRVGAQTASPVDLPRALFDEQLATLSGNGRIVALDHALDLLEKPRGADRPVVLTFDDGTTDWVDEVLPVLVRHRAPATFYVATDFVERGVSFPSGAAISWAGLAELVSSGLATIGSHTHTHALLDRADAATAADELVRSIDLIGERLGISCEHFAYPKALLGSAGAEPEVRRRFRSAAVAGSRPNRYGATDVHRLSRTPIQVGDGMRWFQHKADGGMRLEDAARELLNRRRYAGATT
jgi:peptidoglycan/xylan/chitin deacetylase (PgdA/CDA1 family)